MRRALWLTDIHLNFCDEAGWRRFAAEAGGNRPDLVLAGGDIHEAPGVRETLCAMHATWKVPVYFVLGNHDYYHGSIRVVRRAMRALCEAKPGLVWLAEAGVVRLTDDTALFGHGCWGDGRVGDLESSKAALNDHRLIREFSECTRDGRAALMKQLADEAWNHLRARAMEAAPRFRNLLVLTHVPPFREAARHPGSAAAGDYLPYFACGAAGQALLDVMRRRPRTRMLVLSGHTHGGGHVRPLPNLDVLTGNVAYGHPAVQVAFDLEHDGIDAVIERYLGAGERGRAVSSDRRRF